MKIAGKWKISLENRKDIANKHWNFAIKLFNYSKKKTEYFLGTIVIYNYLIH